MSGTPLISVIIPTYNRAAFLQEAVASVWAQTERDFELLIVDDGSTDETPQLCTAWGARVRYLRQPRRGVSAARNHGVHAAAGRFIAFLDSDDLWAPNKLARQRLWLEQHPGVLLCHTNEIWIRNGRRVNQKKIHRKAGGWIYPLCLPRCVISPSAVFLRRELLEATGEFDEDLPLCEDYDLWLRVTAHHEVGFLDEALVIKRGGHADQLSRSEWGLDRYRVRALLKMLHQGGLRAEWQQATLAMLLQKCHILVQGYTKHGRTLPAVYYAYLMETFGAAAAGEVLQR
ncbi:MAG: glycosyltransferase [candidate division KSB1 bacterium]|nr:glycosyltransferase [candidate division KSB1 bacterium]MDZ7274566.1 glycosyltransferase [candidate division KSB1 bacterium]MDZ7284773.1 glycosyltransferase [candidate division KSB1 bacterium]MDZ7297807.1 glycosyltransferase [candidate division KSB1 bacterium]MDZ7307771.1 glycosyltransferase [candidate division KSB1 bacterium]